MKPIDIEAIVEKLATTEVLEFYIGEVIEVSGVKARVQNVARDRLVVHPTEKPVFLIKGWPFVLKKMIGQSMVLTPIEELSEGANIRRVLGDTDTGGTKSPSSGEA